MGAAGIRAPLARRDQLLAANGNNGSFNSLTTDKIAISLDPYHNHLDEVWFEMNPAGVRGDQFNGDPSWDPVWEGCGARSRRDGWTAELRIPYSQLRFSRDSAADVGACRSGAYVDRLNEQDMWSFRTRDESGGPGVLRTPAGDRGRRAVRASSSCCRTSCLAASSSTRSPSDPYNDTQRHALERRRRHQVQPHVEPHARRDDQSGLRPGRGGSGDAQPVGVRDVLRREAPLLRGQPERVQLRRHELHVLQQLLRPRRAVLAAHRPAAAAQRLGEQHARRTLDAPDDATILGAAKITGRTSSGYTVGLLDAVAGRETARYRDRRRASPRSAQAVEPLTNYFMGRVRKELRQGATTVGVVATNTVRRLGDDSVLVSQLREQRERGGARLEPRVEQPHVSLARQRSPAPTCAARRTAIALTQRSSTHYFQRPDREVTSDGLFSSRYDTTATSMRGYGLYTRLAKENGNWLWEAQTNWRSPGFEVNDLAFLDRTDYRWMSANLARNWTTPAEAVSQHVRARSAASSSSTTTATAPTSQRQAYFSMEFHNYWNLRTFVITKRHDGRTIASRAAGRW